MQKIEHSIPKAKRRDKEEIIFEILKAARVPTTRTRLIYTSFLSGTELKNYVKLLIDCKMLQPDELNKKLMTTEEGRRFIKIYENLSNAGRITIANSYLVNSQNSFIAACP
jgi:predicted transcriptional regulator